MFAFKPEFEFGFSVEAMAPSCPTLVQAGSLTVMEGIHSSVLSDWLSRLTCPVCPVLRVCWGSVIQHSKAFGPAFYFLGDQTHPEMLARQAGRPLPHKPLFAAGTSCVSFILELPPRGIPPHAVSQNLFSQTVKHSGLR